LPRRSAPRNDYLIIKYYYYIHIIHCFFCSLAKKIKDSMRTKYALIVVFSAFMLNLSAQQTSPEIISTSGNYDSNTNNSISWTIGELVIETENNSNNTLTQGFHQNDYIITSMEDSDLDYQISVFPNPTTNHVFVKMNNNEDFHIYLYDLNGKMLYHSKNENQTAQIDMSIFAKASYILRLHNVENQFIKSYKIIKQ